MTWEELIAELKQNFEETQLKCEEIIGQAESQTSSFPNNTLHVATTALDPFQQALNDPKTNLTTLKNALINVFETLMKLSLKNDENPHTIHMFDLLTKYVIDQYKIICAHQFNVSVNINMTDISRTPQLQEQLYAQSKIRGLFGALLKEINASLPVYFSHEQLFRTLLGGIPDAQNPLEKLVLFELYYPLIKEKFLYTLPGVMDKFNFNSLNYEEPENIQRLSSGDMNDQITDLIIEQKKQEDQEFANSMQEDSMIETRFRVKITRFLGGDPETTLQSLIQNPTDQIEDLARALQKRNFLHYELRGIVKLYWLLEFIANESNQEFKTITTNLLSKLLAVANVLIHEEGIIHLPECLISIPGVIDNHLANQMKPLSATTLKQDLEEYKITDDVSITDLLTPHDDTIRLKIFAYNSHSLPLRVEKNSQLQSMLRESFRNISTLLLDNACTLEQKILLQQILENGKYIPFLHLEKADKLALTHGGVISPKALDNIMTKRPKTPFFQLKKSPPDTPPHHTARFTPRAKS